MQTNVMNNAEDQPDIGKDAIGILMGVTNENSERSLLKGRESDSYIYLQHPPPRVRPKISPLINQLGDIAVVLTGADTHLNVRQRRLKRYFDGQQCLNGRDHSRCFGANTSSEMTWRAFWAG